MNVDALVHWVGVASVAAWVWLGVRRCRSGWLAGRRVFLVLPDGSMSVGRLEWSDSGWYCNPESEFSPSYGRSWVLLNDDGTTSNPGLVVKWLPHSGFPGTAKAVPVPHPLDA